MKLLANSRRGVAVALAMVTLIVMPVIAPGKAANAGLISSKSAYVISIPDLPGFWKAWKANAIYSAYKKAISTSDIAAQMEPLGEEIETIEKALGFKLDGETAAAMIKSVDVYIVPGENAGAPAVGLVVAASDRQKLEKLIDLAEKAAVSAATPSPEEKDDSSTTSPEENKESSGNMGGGADEETGDAQTSGPVSTETYNGVEVKKFDGGEKREVYYAMLGDQLVASNEPSEIKAIIDRSKGGMEAGTLSDSAAYKKTEAGLSEQPGELYIYIDHEKALELQSSQQGMELIANLFQKFAPSAISSSSIKFEPKQVIVYTYAPFREGEEGAAGKELFKKHPADKSLEIVGFAPPKCLLLVATNLVDAKLFQQYISSLMGLLGGIGANIDIDEQIKTFETQMGFSLKEDLVPAIGNEGSFMLNSVEMGGLLPSVDAAIIVKVADKEKMKKVLGGVEKFASAALGAANATNEDAEKSGTAALKSETIGGATVKYVEVPTIPGYSPSFAITGDYLVVATSKESIGRLIDIKAGKSPSLAGSDIVKALSPRVTPVANNFSFANLEEIWSTVIAVAEKFPAGETVTKIVDALKVFKAAGSSEKATDNAVVSQVVLQLQ